jgi:N-formylmaleamate deformylase
MTDWSSGDVVANGIRVHYYRTSGSDRTGGAKPPIVLSHGFSDDGLCWTRLARALEADYDVVMPDARGHGLSAAPDSGYSATERAADLAGLITALGLARPAIGGHSMGAQTALYCAALYPELVGCAILEDPGLRLASEAPSPAESEARMAQMRKQMEESRSASREQLIASIRKQRPTWDEVELGPWADSKKRLSANAGIRLRAEEPLTWQEALAKVSCPTLLITSDPGQGGIVTPEAAAEAQRILPALRVIRLSGAGHNIRREAFEPFVSAISSFLAESRLSRD